MSWLRLSLALLLCSCATAADNDEGPAPEPDARKSFGFPDAAPRADAGPLPDATPPPPDAAPPPPDADNSGGMCAQNSDCTSSGECCFVIACVPGTEIGNDCLPIN